MNNIDDLRAILGDTMKRVVSGEMSADQARAIAQVGAVVCDTAKLEIDLVRASEGEYKGGGFIDTRKKHVTHSALKRIG